MKKLFAIIMMLVSVSAFAATSGLSSGNVNDAGFSKLSEAEKAEIIKQVADKAATKNVFGQSEDTEKAVDKVEHWAAVGAKIGQGLAGAAKELGVAVNDFANTSVGKLTTGLIIWHFIGNKIVHVFGGIMIWIIGFGGLRYMINRVAGSDITYSKDKTNVFGYARVEKVVKRELSDVMTGWSIAIGIGILILGVIIMVTG